MVQRLYAADDAVQIPLGLLWLDVRPAAMDRDNNLAVAQYRHGVPHGGVGDSVLFGKAPLAGELRRDLALGDPPLDVVRNLHIGIFRPKGIDRTSAHTSTIGCSLSCDNFD
jgi:hypothetical protein